MKVVDRSFSFPGSAQICVVRSPNIFILKKALSKASNAAML